jgi:hypothetical protein
MIARCAGAMAGEFEAAGCVDLGGLAALGLEA